jgi:porphobilinogen deaminase
VAARATVETPGEAWTLRLQGRVIALGGERVAQGLEHASVRSVEDAERAGVALAERLLAEGAAEILSEVRASVVPVVPEP